MFHSTKQFCHTCTFLCSLCPSRCLSLLALPVCHLPVYNKHVSCHICYAAILSRWRCGPEENILGKESRPAVSALRLVSVHPSHRQAHQEVCPLTERSGYDFRQQQHRHTRTVAQQVQTISHKNAFRYSQRAAPLILSITTAYGIKWDYEII